MSDLVASLRAVVTSLLVVFACALVLFVVIAGALLGLGTAVGVVADFAASSSGGGQSAAFAVEVDDGEATVVHEGEETYDAEQLFVEVNDEPRGSWAEHDGSAGTVAEGDSIAIADVESGDLVTVLLIDEGDDRPVELHSEQV